MTREELVGQIVKKQSYLCVGLDPDETKVPQHLLESSNWILEFNKSIVDAVADHCVAFKPNTAFYECYGHWGWEQLELTVSYIKENYLVTL